MRACLLTALALTTTTLSCNQISYGEDNYFFGDASIWRASVTRESDNAALFTGCRVEDPDLPPPSGPIVRFQAASGTIVLMKGEAETVSKRRIGSDNPSLHDHTDTAYWCGEQDGYSVSWTDISGARCDHEVGADPVAKILSVSLDPSPPADADAFYGGAKSYTMRLEIRHPGMFLTEPDATCFGRSEPPSPLLEVLP